MKKIHNVLDDGMRPEYDFASMRGGVRGKYAKRIREGTNIVLLAPEVVEAFPTEDSVNEALRGVLSTTRAVRRGGGLPNQGAAAAEPRAKRFGTIEEAIPRGSRLSADRQAATGFRL